MLCEYCSRSGKEVGVATDLAHPFEHFVDSVLFALQVEDVIPTVVEDAVDPGAGRITGNFEEHRGGVGKCAFAAVEVRSDSHGCVALTLIRYISSKPVGRLVVS